MVLTKKKEERLKRMPNIETRLRKSKDGKYLINQTIITHVRPLDYYEAILNGSLDGDLEVEEIVV
ncbi:hypothetical protein HON01_05595 [Candidatus Woesearchaeota archaeon]|jgi:hypothetical protein|nr:hypothetical protein [Candidatus Woesearchaeota archaeon]MBT7367617.1 hypothetical protein [Candidatus Woesearchaeota archaeon]